MICWLSKLGHKERRWPRCSQMSRVEREAQAIWDSEREASRVDAENHDVGAEDLAWEATLADGLD